jgi:hypothetical protein
MARPQVADRGDALQVWRTAANILNKQSHTADKGWSFSLGVERGAINYSPLTISLLRNLLEDSHNTLNRWKNYYSQLLNVHRIGDVRQIEIRTAEPLVPHPSPIEVEIAIAKFKRHKSPGNDEILAELFQAGGEILRSKIHKLIKSIWNKD